MYPIQPSKSPSDTTNRLSSAGATVLGGCFVVVFLLIFCTFHFMLLFFLFFVGYYLSAMMWFDLEEESFVDGSRPSTAPIRLSAVLFMQQSLNGGCRYYRLGLFIEFFCHYSPPYAALGKSWLVYGSSGIINKIIAYTLLLSMIMYYIFSFGFVVGLPTPLLFDPCNLFSLI